jgi:xanthine dehydrogenase YagR molybdenum-binding subunit
MKFDTPATTNPIDHLQVIGHSTSRIDGPFKTTGRATYAHEWHDIFSTPAYGYIVGSAIAKGRIAAMDISRAKAASGVIAIVTPESAGNLGKGKQHGEATRWPQIDRIIRLSRRRRRDL